MKLFGSSGIRGIINDDITPILTQKVGSAIATQFDGGAVLVGRDTRHTGQMLETAFISGIVSCGVAAGTLSIVPTPVVAWLTREMEAEAGVSITASHNPVYYNGLKIFDSKGIAYSEEQQKRVEKAIEEDNFHYSTWNNIGKAEKIDANRLYIDSMADEMGLELDFKIVCDFFNGAVSTIAPELFNEIGCNTTLINANIDGRFPAGSPEPNNHSLQRVGRLVRIIGADIGFGFDGDGDRMMAVDDEGKIPNPDRVLTAYARHVVEQVGGGTVVTHVGSSMSIEEAVESLGGSVVRTKVGDTHIAHAIESHNAVFGGEPVGAWIHPEVHLCPDGILSALKLMAALKKYEMTLKAFLNEIPEYPILRTKIQCPNSKKNYAMKNVSTEFKNHLGKILDISTIDGVRLELDDGWILIRPSGTEPLIRITVEAKNIKRANEILNEGQNFVRKVLGE